MKLLLPLAHYHIIYLIIKLFQINFMFIWLEDYSIFIKPFINTTLIIKEFQTSLLLTKYYNKTNVVLNTTNCGVYFYLQPFRNFSPLITQQSF